MSICFLFPGQGAQFPGMGKDLWEDYQCVKDLFKQASEKTGLDMQKLIFEGSAEDLRATDKTQVAITLINLSAAMVLKEKGIEAAGTAGFSLGEYAALAEAGVISRDDIFPIVKARGEIMEKVSRSLDSPAGNPGMAAVIGLSYADTEKALTSANLDNVFIANYNSPVQIVLSGTHDGLLAAQDIMTEAGAKRYIPLKVSGPFHCPLLNDVKTELRETLAGYNFQNPAKPVYSNVTGKPIKTGSEAKDLCIEQITSPVQWVVEEQNLVNDGFKTFLEVGPGVVLCGLLKRFSRDYTCYAAGTLNDINKIQI